MVIPSNENDTLDNSSVTKSGGNRKIYYEVGCKILELNKIYK